MRQDDVGLKESAQYCAELGQGEETALPVLQSLDEPGHDVQLLERQDSQALGETSQPVGCALPPAPLPVVLAEEHGLGGLVGVVAHQADGCQLLEGNEVGSLDLLAGVEDVSDRVIGQSGDLKLLRPRWRK